MGLARYLALGASMPEEGTPSIEVGWVSFCSLKIDSGQLWAGDASMVWAETHEGEGGLVKLPAADYAVSAKVVWLGKRCCFFRNYFVSRLRVCLASVAEAKLGKKLASIGTDSGQIGVCDPCGIQQAFKNAFGNDNSAAVRSIEDIPGRYGILRPEGSTGAAMPYVNSGLGDGGSPVYELVSNGKCVGVELEFMPDGYVYGS